MRGAVALALMAAVLAGCAVRSYKRGEEAARAGDWDAAVTYYRQALQEHPDRSEYRIALERAMLEAAAVHRSKAQVLDREGDIAAALPAYRRILDYDPGDRDSMRRAAEIERTLRDQAEAERPRPRIDAMREEARRKTQTPLLSPASKTPLDLSFTESSVREVLSTIASTTGINIIYESTATKQLEQTITIDLVDVTVEEALDQVLTMNVLWYKVMNPRTIMVIPDNVQKRMQYEAQVIRTFYLSHSDAAEMAQVVKQMIGIPGVAPPPAIVGNKTQNSLTVRASDRVIGIVEQIVTRNDRPPAEITVDVEILEVSRRRAKQIGVNLDQYRVGTIFSPEQAPGSGDDGAAAPPFNLNTITRGVSPADFYLSVPQAVVNFLESDSRSRTLAKPQLRGMEGQELVLNLGDQIPIPSTTFSGVAGGGAQFVPFTSFQYQPVGVNVTMTPRVTYDDEILLELVVENSSLGENVDIGGQSLPRIVSRRAETFLRLREGEAHLLAGLVQERATRALTGLPGLIRIPAIQRLFGYTDDLNDESDVIMLITPRIVRTHELSQDDLDPIHIGSQNRLGLSGPPPLIAPPPEAEEEQQPQVPGGVPPEPGAAATEQPAPGEGTAETPQPAQTPPGEALPVEGQEQQQQPTPPSAARVTVTVPGSELAMGGGPYTAPISVVGGSRVSTMSLTITFDPSVLSVRTVQQGTYMNQGGVQPTFTQRVDPKAGRIDITVTRPSDKLGASGTGLLGAVLFDPVAAGSTQIAPSGVATAPDGSPVSLQLDPASVTVK
ncbi:MAG: hypothetical protein GEV06_25385 [Luteitalea sp.]|nr:hypothetical protein [Luteitalea sp.]